MTFLETRTSSSVNFLRYIIILLITFVLNACHHVQFNDKPLDELTNALLSFERPIRSHRTATVPIIRNFYLGIGLRQLLYLPEF